MDEELTQSWPASGTLDVPTETLAFSRNVGDRILIQTFH